MTRIEMRVTYDPEADAAKMFSGVLGRGLDRLATNNPAALEADGRRLAALGRERLTGQS